VRKKREEHSPTAIQVRFAVHPRIHKGDLYFINNKNTRAMSKTENESSREKEENKGEEINYLI